MRSAAIRTRRLARDMLIFWKRVDKEQVFFNLLSLLFFSSTETKFGIIAFYFFSKQQYMGLNTI